MIDQLKEEAHLPAQSQQKNNTRKRCEICSQLATKIPERGH